MDLGIWGSLIYRVTSRTDRATQNLCLEKQNTKQNKSLPTLICSCSKCTLEYISLSDTRSQHRTRAFPWME